MDQAANAGGLAGGDDFFRQLDMRVGKILAIGEFDIPAMQDTDQIDHGIVTAHQFDQSFFAMNVGFRHFNAGLHDQRLGALTAPRRHSDFDTALRKTIDDVGTDVTATPQQQDLFDVHVEPRKLFRKTRILRQI